jgi:hypothetical protein
MRVRVTIYHSKEFDPDNLGACQKPILDALVNIGFLANDDGTHLELLAPEQVLSKDKHTLVMVTPIP